MQLFIYLKLGCVLQSWLARQWSWSAMRLHTLIKACGRDAGRGRESWSPLWGIPKDALDATGALGTRVIVCGKAWMLISL